MLRSLLFSIATVLLAIGAPLATLSSTSSSDLLNQDLHTLEINQSNPTPPLSCPEPEEE